MGLKINELPPHVREIVAPIATKGERAKRGHVKGERLQERRQAGRMTKTEAKYAAHLEMLKHAGAIHWYAFETTKFRLADKTYYTPDFVVMTNLGEWEVHEVKGHWEDDARVKIKVAAERIPMLFIAVKASGDGWKFEYIPGLVDSISSDTGTA